MIEYLPWSHITHKYNMEKYAKGSLSCLDIELGGECNYHCVYCDSPDRKKKCSISVQAIGKLLSTGQFQWIYICGLGEPTFNQNQKVLIQLLEYCRIYGVRCSIFSNLSQLTDELVQFVQEGILHLFFKYDSDNLVINRALYGTSDIRNQLDNVKRLRRLVQITDGMTNMAASIVPTRLNKEYVLPIVQECLDSNIFPLLGELELSGKGETNYENLYLTTEELLELKEKIEIIIGESYSIPICPSVISGIHFSHDGYITVDRFSGLSCHWFWLKEPQVERIMPFTLESDLNVITEKILKYRDGCMDNVKNYLELEQRVGGAFGGCGGDIHQLFREYLEYHRRDIK